MNDHPTTNELMRADSDLFAKVMTDRGVKPEQVSVVTGISVGHVRRMMSGQYPPNAIAWRCLWTLTQDARLVEFLLGDGHVLVHVLPPDDGRDMSRLLSDQVMANAMVVRDAQAGDHEALAGSLRAAMSNLQTIYQRSRHTGAIGGVINTEA